MLPPVSEQWAKEQLVHHLDEIGGHEFEKAMVEVFRRMGYHTERGKLSNDYGRDIILRRDSEVVVVECKHQASSVGRPVVQKLHSAAKTYRATRGLLVTTSWLAQSAQQYAADVHETDRIRVDLWDYSTLVREARAVGVYFIGSLHGTHAFFWVPWRNDGDMSAFVRSAHLGSLQSSPRSIETAVQNIELHRQVLSGLIADSKVDKPFKTQAGYIHRATHLGRRIYSNDGRVFSAPEQSYWAQSNPTLLALSELDGKEVATYFGQPVGAVADALRSEIAGQLSRTVKYAGKNNQQYERFCEVRSEDVEVQTKQVLLARWNMNFEVGPRRFAVHFADEATRRPSVVAASGFDNGVEGFSCGRGFLCNDCGLIAPNEGASRGAVCESCSRTLCHAHTWTWPALLFGHRSKLCSACYDERQHTSNEHSSNPALRDYWPSLLVSVVPGLQCFLGKRYIWATVLLLLFLCTLLVGYSGNDIPPAVLVGISVLWSMHWTSRIRAHNRNIERLALYSPTWQ